MSQLTHYNDIFGYIKMMEGQYKLPVRLTDTWDWNMEKHLNDSYSYLNGQWTASSKGDYDPVKNIVLPIINLAHRTEDIELKDVQIYVDDPDNYHLSFLVKKYHDDVFVQENDLDTFFDELNVSRIDYGGGLSKAVGDIREVVPLESIAFCDQTDLLSGPIGIKHYYSPDQLLDMEKVGWGKAENGATHSLEEVIYLSREEKRDDNGGRLADTPGRYIEVYEVHGNLPKYFSDKTYSGEKYETALFIVCFYSSQTTHQKEGIILYTAPERKTPFKLIKRDPIFGRALGRGGVEELFENQAWTNYDMVRRQQMLDAAAVTVMASTDPSIAAKHPSGLKGLKNMEVIDKAPGTEFGQVDTYPRNIKLFYEDVDMWSAHAQQTGSANDAIMGESPSAGTPFKLQELVVQNNQGLHEYRRQQYAKHIEECYKDTYIPKIIKKITNGTTWLSELSLEDLQYVADCLKRSEWKKYADNKVLNGEPVEQGEKELFMQQVDEEFKRKGQKHFIEILKGEFKNIGIGVKVDVAGKSKNLAAMTDKIVNIFRFAFSNPQGFAQTMQIPGMAKSFNQILEFSGLSPADFSGIDKIAQQMQPQTPQQPQPSPLQLPQPQNA